MGRRKIEIRAIKDDRNRSVTFLKRKGGLFKKAYELGVLCSVDVAVIVFGNNKKLYQFSSGNINETLARYQYHAGAPHEHKTPGDFEGKRAGADWDDDDDDGDVMNDFSPPVSQLQDSPEPISHHHRHHHQLHKPGGLQHMRHATASASPPQRQYSAHRSMTPQSHTYSRPSSRMGGGPRRTDSSLNFTRHSHPGPPPPQGPGPYHHQQPPMHNDYSYTSNPSGQYYPAPPPPPMHQHHLPPVMSGPRGESPGPSSLAPMHDPYHVHLPPPSNPQQYHSAPPPPEPSPTPQHARGYPPPPLPPPMNSSQSQHQYHMHQIPPYASHEPRQQSVPPSMSRGRDSPKPLQPSLGLPTSESRISPNLTAQGGQDHLLQPRALAPQSGSTHSIFTPIDDSRSLLAQHWAGSTAPESGRGRSSEQSPQAGQRSPPRSNVDPRITEAETGPLESEEPARPRSAPPGPPDSQDEDVSSLDAMQFDRNKPRLKLKVQIPGEDGEETIEVSAVESNAVPAAAAAAAAAAAPSATQSAKTKGVVLPPPSPSARNPLLSAGATGPNNPFAWAKPTFPAINNNTPSNGGRDPTETPLSALPSRVMDPSGQMLPSPSELWSIWGTKPSGDNMMPSPINFGTTPVYQSVPNFRELAPANSSGDDRKRRAEGEATPAAAPLEKRIKT